jgi:hypothetical protein
MASKKTATPKWTGKKWTLRLDDRKNKLGSGVFKANAEFRLRANRVSKGAPAKTYTVVNVHNMKPPWTTPKLVLTEIGSVWPPAVDPLLPKYSKSSADAYEATGRRVIQDAANYDVRLLSGKFMAGPRRKHHCNVWLYQVPGQIVGGEALLIIVMEDKGYNKLPDGSGYGNS